MAEEKTKDGLTLEQVERHRDQLKAEMDALNPKHDEAVATTKALSAAVEEMKSSQSRLRDEHEKAVALGETLARERDALNSEMARLKGELAKAQQEAEAHKASAGQSAALASESNNRRRAAGERALEAARTFVSAINESLIGD